MSGEFSGKFGLIPTSYGVQDTFRDLKNFVRKKIRFSIENDPIQTYQNAWVKRYDDAVRNLQRDGEYKKVSATPLGNNMFHHKTFYGEEFDGNELGSLGIRPIIRSNDRDKPIRNISKIALIAAGAVSGAAVAGAAVGGLFGGDLQEDEGKAFSVYHINSDKSMIDTLKKYFPDPKTKNLLFEDTHSKAIVNSFPSDYRFIIAGTSFDEIVTTKFDQAEEWGFDKDDVLLYNIERWETTPEEEQRSPVESIDKTMLAIKEMGYKPGIAPSLEILQEHYKDIKWENVGFANLQFQRYSGFPEKVYGNVKELTDFIKSKNPVSEIFVQLDFREANNCYDPNKNSIRPWDDPKNFGKTEGNENCAIDVERSLKRLEDTISQVSKIKNVDGIMVTYMPHVPGDKWQNPTFPCPTQICIPNNPINLERILTFIQKLPR